MYCIKLMIFYVNSSDIHTVQIYCILSRFADLNFDCVQDQSQACLLLVKCSTPEL